MNTKEAALAYKALGDETRLTIIKELASSDEMCACHLLEVVKCNQSTLSHHMKILVDSKLVNVRKDWKWSHYSLNRETLKELSLEVY